MWRGQVISIHASYRKPDRNIDLKGIARRVVLAFGKNLQRYDVSGVFIIFKSGEHFVSLSIIRLQTGFDEV